MDDESLSDECNRFAIRLNPPLMYLRLLLALSTAAVLCLTETSAQLTFDAAVRVPVRTSAVGVADLDGDGVNDLLVAAGTQTWRKGPDFATSYTLGTSPNGGPYAARAADIDGDGDVDWVTSNGSASASQGNGELYVYLNPGAAAVTGAWPRVTAYSGPGFHLNDMVVADVDADGKLDIVTKTWVTSDRLVVAFQDSPTSWTARAFDTGETGRNTEGVAVGEIDGGGAPEIIQAGFYYTASPADWRAGPVTSKPIAARFLAEEMKAGVADFDGDGDNDVYMASAEGNADVGAYWYRNDGNGAFAERLIEAGVGEAHMHEVVDVDRDGDVDVVAGRSFGSTGVYIYYNDGAGAFTKSVVDAGKQLYTGVVADLDADGDLDIVGPQGFYNVSGVSYYLNAGSVTPPAAPTGAAAALTPDGAAVAVTWADNSADEGSFQLERQAGGGAWAPLVTLPPNTTAHTDATAAPGATYAYRVRAVNGGASAYATTAAVTTLPQAGAVAASPGGGDYSDPPAVTLTAAAPGDEIRYTLDGTEPTAASPLYAGPVTVAASARLRARGFGASLQPGPVTTEDYTISPAPDPGTDPGSGADPDAPGPGASAGPVAYWRLDEGEGAGTAADAVGDRDGALAPGASLGAAGRVGGAASFDGAAGKIDVPAFDVAGAALTLQAWVRPATLNSVEGRIISKATGRVASQHYWMLSQIKGSGVRARLKTAGAPSTLTLASSPGLLAAGEWALVTATYDGARLRLYVGASEVASAPLTGAIAPGAGAPVAIGNQPAGDRGFDGLLDEVRVYDRALTPGEIAAAAEGNPQAATLTGFPTQFGSETTYRSSTPVDGGIEHAKRHAIGGLVDLATVRLAYPNPASDYVHVTPADSPRELSLFDLTGRRIAVVRLATGETQVSLAGVPPGAYVLQDDGTVVWTVIVE